MNCDLLKIFKIRGFAFLFLSNLLFCSPSQAYDWRRPPPPPSPLKPDEPGPPTIGPSPPSLPRPGLPAIPNAKFTYDNYKPGQIRLISKDLDSLVTDLNLTLRVNSRTSIQANEMQIVGFADIIPVTGPDKIWLKMPVGCRPSKPSEVNNKKIANCRSFYLRKYLLDMGISLPTAIKILSMTNQPLGKRGIEVEVSFSVMGGMREIKRTPW